MTILRDPYVAIVAAGTANSGIYLTASETHALLQDDAIVEVATSRLTKFGQNMVAEHGWGFLRYIKRNRAAVTEDQP